MKAVFIIDNKRIIERRVIANEFNKYFVSLASKLNDEVKIQSGDFSNFLPRNQSNIMFLNECCEDEVSIIIKDLQNGKSSDIPIDVIKKTSKIISPILASNFNYLMEVGIFPDELNDISNICNSNELILFADDTNIFVKAKSKHEVYIEANII